jgi:hypothetical protein
VYEQNLLLLIAQIAGVLLLMSIVWLLYKRAIYLDAETGKPVSFDVPIFGKIQTQSPVIALVLIAAALVIYPATRAKDQIRQGTVQGSVETDGTPVTVTVVMLPNEEETVMSSGGFKIQVPILPDTHYRARFSVNKQVQTDQAFDLNSDGAKLIDFKYVGAPPIPPVAPKKEVSDDRLKSLGIS